MMHSPDNWEIKLELQKYLANQLNKGRLCIVLGAGISKSFGLPDWQTLIKNLYDEKGKTLSNDNFMEAAEKYKTEYQQDYISDVKKALYKDANIEFTQLTTQSTLAAIGALVMASKRGTSSKVITYNFDNVLELYLNYFGLASNSKYETLHWASSADVEIYHPHGFLPYKVESNSEEIVFDQASYSKIIGNRTNPWNIHLSSIMMTHTCLFIGLSGKDLDLDSIIHNTIGNHKSIQSNYPYWGVSFVSDDNEKNKWKERKIFPYKIKSDFSDLPDFLITIAQCVANLRMDE